MDTIEETEGVKYHFEPRLVLLYIFGVTDSRAYEVLSRSDEWSANTLTILLVLPSRAPARARDRVPVELP